MSAGNGAAAGQDAWSYTKRHLRFGWWSLLVFLTLGIALEAMHGLKVRWYLDASNETRRLMWTLAHAHGSLLGLAHVAFAFTLHVLSEQSAPWRAFASRCLMAASLLLPGGFLLGGLVIYAGDPGIGIALVPVGAGVFLLGVLRTAWGVSSAQ